MFLCSAMLGIGPILVIGNGQPNQMEEKPSFLKENIIPIEESGQLHFIDAPEGSLELIAV